MERASEGGATWKSRHDHRIGTLTQTNERAQRGSVSEHRKSCTTNRRSQRCVLNKHKHTQPTRRPSWPLQTPRAWFRLSPLWLSVLPLGPRATTADSRRRSRAAFISQLQEWHEAPPCRCLWHQRRRVRGAAYSAGSAVSTCQASGVLGPPPFSTLVCPSDSRNALAYGEI